MSGPVFWTFVGVSWICLFLLTAWALGSLIRQAIRRELALRSILRTREELRQQTLAHALRQDVQP